MTGVSCPHCGNRLAPHGLTAGQTVACPVCHGDLQVWGDADSPPESAWSNPVEHGERKGVRYILPERPEGCFAQNVPDPFSLPAGDHLEAQAAPLEEEPQPSRPTAVNYALAGLAVFLIALIAVVLAARQLRPLLARQNAPPAPVTLDDWIDRLEHGPDESARQEAARTILDMGPEAVVAALDATTFVPADGNILEHSPAVIRAMAATGPELVPALAEALSSDKQNVRAAAANVLREMGADARGAVEPLGAVLADENRWVRWFAVDTLGNLGPDAAAAVDALIPLVDHADRYTRRRAVVALGRIGPAAKAAVPALTHAAAMDKERSVRKAAEVALNQVNLEELAAEAAAQADDEVRELIEQLQEGDEYESVAAAKSLGRLGREAAAAVPALTQALGQENKWLREAAANALGALRRDAHTAVPALKKLLDDEEPEVRTAAEKALERIEGL